tara:strand:+ start:165 stop:482 length:318 start_codon:yes stop_codon:yes gene_type:complete
MKTFNQALGEMKTSIWDTSPKTLQDAIDPEIWIEGFGRMLLSQHKARFVRASDDFLKRAKADDYDYIEGRMNAYHHMLEGIKQAEKDMNTPAWKTRITKLKKAGK